LEPAPGGYLSRHLEPKSVEHTDDAAVLDEGYNLNCPIIDGIEVDYNKHEGLVLERDGRSFEAQYTPLSKDETDRMLHGLRTARNEAHSPSIVELIEKMINFYSSGTYHLDKFRVQKGDNVLDLDGLAKSVGANIVFNPKNEIDENSLDTSKRILTSGDITKVSTVVKILHEIGHLMRPGDESKGAIKRYLSRESITELEAEEILHSERDAWAFTLKKIKPFLEGEQREDILNFIHGYCLSYYSGNIREQMAPKRRLIIPHLLESLSE